MPVLAADPSTGVADSETEVDTDSEVTAQATGVDVRRCQYTDVRFHGVTLYPDTDIPRLQRASWGRAADRFDDNDFSGSARYAREQAAIGEVWMPVLAADPSTGVADSETEVDTDSEVAAQVSRMTFAR